MAHSVRSLTVATAIVGALAVPNASAQVDQEVKKQLTAVADGLKGVQDMLNQIHKQIAGLPTLPDIQAKQLELIQNPLDAKKTDAALEDRMAARQQTLLQQLADLDELFRLPQVADRMAVETVLEEYLAAIKAKQTNTLRPLMLTEGMFHAGCSSTTMHARMPPRPPCRRRHSQSTNRD